MGWSTELYTSISFNRKTYNHKYEVEDDLENLNKCIKTCKENLRDLAIMTEPSKHFHEREDCDPIDQVTAKFEDNIELLEEYLIERTNLEHLLDAWDRCHNKEGYAIEPPENIHWDTAYLWGDFVESDKNPKKNTIDGLK